MNLKQLRQRDADLRAEIARATKDKAMVGEKAVAEKRVLTDEERAKFLAFTPVIDGLQAQLAENAELLAAAEAANEAERNYRGPVPDPDADAGAAAARAAGTAPRVEMGADRTTKAPGFFGRQMQAVYRMAVAHGNFGQLASADQAVLKPMMAGGLGMNSDVASEGGFLVSHERSSTIVQRAYEEGAILSRLRPLGIGAGSNGMLLPAVDETSRADNSRYGGIVSGWLGQGGSLTAGKPKFRLMDLKLRKVGAFVYGTDELIADAVALENWINTYLPLELRFRVENAILNGTGANQPLGVLNGGALVTVTRAGASHVTSDDLRGMWKRMWAPARNNAVWLYDQSIEDELDALGIAIGTAGMLDPSYKPAGSVPGQVYATYKGRPLIPVEHCANIGTAGDIVLWSPDDYQTIDKDGVQQAVSIHVAFLTDESCYRFIYRIDGQPISSTTLTPKSGGNALTSSAVVLS